MRFITVDVVLTALLEIVKVTKLSTELLAIYSEAYVSFIERLREFAKKEEVGHSLIFLFEDQWTYVKQYEKKRLKNQMKALTNAAALFEKCEDTKIRIPELLVFPNTIGNTMKSLINIFYILKETLALLRGNEIDNTLPFKDKYIVITPETFQFSDKYKVINCKELVDADKNESKIRFLIKDDKTFILLEPNYEKLEEPKVILTRSMASISLIPDFNNLRKLTIYIQSLEGKIEKVLYFDNHMMVSYVKNWIEEAAANNLKEQLQLVEDYLNACKELN